MQGSLSPDFAFRYIHGMPVSQVLWRSSRNFPGTRAALRWWKNAHGTELPARGFVWIIHGLGEHSGRYDELASFLNQAGFDVLAPDHPGHGLSRLEGGQRRLADFPEMVRECRDALRWWTSEGPLSKRGILHTPWHLVGHSMGGLVALEWVRQGQALANENEPVADFALRVFVSAPPLRLVLPVPGWKQVLAKGLAQLAPDLQIANGIQAAALSYDAANVAAYREDPLVHGHASPRYFLSMNETAARVLANPQDLEVPIALAVGEDDPIVDPSAVRELFDSLATHKRFLLFPHAKHEIFNETCRRDVYRALAEWIL